ncbi:hypothetical protein QUA70_19750 [Microcoleus sp. LAD1_D5]|uniref:hypothetical protein n=1 Tax=Microcoleus sp. LAD1_D5 TaxID=2818813 RepID=UPI002FCEE25B
MKSLNETIEHLGIKKATLYSWLKKTGIKSTKVNNLAYFDDESIAILKELKIHLDNGGTFESWGQSELMTISPESIDSPDLSESEILEELEELPQYDPIAELMENAKRQAAGVLIAQNVLARKYIDDPDSLPPEYQELVNKSKPLPKSIDPLQYAQSLTGMNLDFLNQPESLEDPESLEEKSLEENQAEAMLEPLAA